MEPRLQSLAQRLKRASALFLATTLPSCVSVASSPLPAAPSLEGGAPTSGSATPVASLDGLAQLRALYAEHQRVLVLVDDTVYVFECATPRAVDRAGDRQRELGDAGEKRELGGVDVGREIGGADEAREIGGADEAREIGGADEAREVDGADEAREVGGADEAREIGGANEAREIGGADEAREVDGADEAREVGGADEAREIGGADEGRSFGAADAILRCTEIQNYGFRIDGFGARQVRFFDGIALRDAPNGFIPD